ncbi:MAG: flavodoxin family protein [Christensenellaceae bacterium]
MAKKVLILSTSFRKNGNSETLANAFLQGAKDNGAIAEMIRLADKTIGFCRGCLACQRTHACVIRDDANAIAEKMRTADVLVFATPIYYYEMSGQMKTLLDRANPLFSSDYAFRDIYLLTTAADAEEGTDARAINGLEGWIECFPKARLAGTIFAGGVNGVGEIKGHCALMQAYEAGRTI